MNDEHKPVEGAVKNEAAGAEAASDAAQTDTPPASAAEPSAAPAAAPASDGTAATVSASATTATATRNTTGTRPTTRGSSPLVLLLRLFVLAVLVWAALHAWQLWQAHRAGFEAAYADDGIMAAIATLWDEPAVATQEDDLLIRLQAAEEAIWQLNELRDKAASSNDGPLAVRPARDIWLVNEALFLARIAEQRLWLGARPAHVLPVLREAHDLLMLSASGALHGLQEAVLRDVAALEKAGDLNMAEVAQRLGVLRQQVSALPFAAERKFVSASNIDGEESDSTTMAHLQEKLSSLFVVRHHAAPVEPMLDAVTHTQYRLLIEADLAQAQMALMNRDPVLFAQSLDRAHAALVVMTPAAPDSVSQMQREIDQLRTQVESTAVTPLRSPALLAAWRERELEAAP